MKTYLAQARGFTIGVIVAVVVGVILIVAVLYPIITDTVDSQNLTGTDAIIGGILGTLALVGGIVLIARMYQS